MSLVFIMLLAILGFRRINTDKDLSGRVLALSAIILFAAIASGRLTSLTLGRFQQHPRLTKPEWSQKNLIIVLGGGTQRWGNELFPNALITPRVTETFRLYRLCRRVSNNCKILASGGDPAGNKISEAQVLSESLQEMGVPLADIMLEELSQDTWQNTELSSKLIRGMGFDYVVLVTSSTHMLRSRELFGYFGQPVVPAPADHMQPEYSFAGISTNFYLFDLVLHEMAGLVKSHINRYLKIGGPT